eukprot:TRINITY_DN67019_c9_g1_i6.p3 TRINITY_DN67019_c9_g1~~TRINITY_DN67019_c9_g1_i6.p3  ORF type:complete len:107 (-),score=10.82 TRINITY_DN67019_c9_g1_i6:227-547(-)
MCLWCSAATDQPNVFCRVFDCHWSFFHAPHCTAIEGDVIEVHLGMCDNKWDGKQQSVWVTKNGVLLDTPKAVHPPVQESCAVVPYLYLERGSVQCRWSGPSLPAGA